MTEADNAVTTDTATDTPPETLLGGDPAGEAGDDKVTDNKITNTAKPEAAAPSEIQAEVYDLTPPEGFPLDAAALKTLTATCRDAKLSKAQAEAVMGYMAGNHSNWQEQQFETSRQWREEIKADKDFGGEKFDESAAEANKALKVFDTDGSVSKLLRESAYGNHPGILRLCARVGRALAQDKLVGTGGGAMSKPLEERMYPNM